MVLVFLLLLLFVPFGEAQNSTYAERFAECLKNNRADFEKMSEDVLIKTTNVLARKVFSEVANLKNPSEVVSYLRNVPSFLKEVYNLLNVMMKATKETNVMKFVVEGILLLFSEGIELIKTFISASSEEREDLKATGIIEYFQKTLFSIFVEPLRCRAVADETE